MEIAKNKMKIACRKCKIFTDKTNRNK